MTQKSAMYQLLAQRAGIVFCCGIERNVKGQERGDNRARVPAWMVPTSAAYTEHDGPSENNRESVVSSDLLVTCACTMYTHLAVDRAFTF